MNNGSAFTGIALLAFLCCGWPLIVHAVLLNAGKILDRIQEWRQR